MTALRRKRLLGMAAALLFAGGPVASLSQDIRVDGVSVIERGVFRGRGGGRPVAESHLGAVANVRDMTLLHNTTTIVARKGLRFGVRYLINGAPKRAELGLRLVTRFPPAGLFDPVGNLRHHESAYDFRAFIGVPSYREFMFDHEWEIVPGEWIFEFWHGERLIGSQRFCVLDGESPLSSTSLRANCEVLIGRHDLHAPARLVVARDGA